MTTNVTNCPAFDGQQCTAVCPGGTSGCANCPGHFYEDLGHEVMVRILLSASPDMLEKELRTAEADGWETATVEAEYGDIVIEGSWLTLAHHAEKWRHKDCPCLHREERWLPDKILIGVSHSDLDSVGGVMAALGRRPGSSVKEDLFAAGFWRAVAFVDVNGWHRREEIAPVYIRCINAYRAWSARNRCPTDVLDVTDHFISAMEAVNGILDGDQTLLSAGDDYADEEEKLETESFRYVYRGVLVRQSEKFVNHMYEHDGWRYEVLVSHNSETGSITLSFANRGTWSARDIMQCVFPDCIVDDKGHTVGRYSSPDEARSHHPTGDIRMLAGGHSGIAGTPRDRRYELDDVRRVIEFLNR